MNILAVIKKNWKKVLRVLIILVCIYLIIDPLAPGVDYQVRKITTNNNQESIIQDYSDEIPSENRLFIPSIWVDVDIVEGGTDKVLSLGAWRRPNSSTPDKGGNTVITGHRYQYTPPSNKTFYNLDKMEKGDKIYIYWSGKKYEYEVDRAFIVAPEETWIEDNTEDSILTLYTCHPLFTAKNRFVVVAYLKNGG
jgi:sortase A